MGGLLTVNLYGLDGLWHWCKSPLLLVKSPYILMVKLLWKIWTNHQSCYSHYNPVVSIIIMSYSFWSLLLSIITPYWNPTWTSSDKTWGASSSLSGTSSSAICCLGRFGTFSIMFLGFSHWFATSISIYPERTVHKIIMKSHIIIINHDI